MFSSHIFLKNKNRASISSKASYQKPLSKFTWIYILVLKLEHFFLNYLRFCLQILSCLLFHQLYRGHNNRHIAGIKTDI